MIPGKDFSRDSRIASEPIGFKFFAEDNPWFDELLLNLYDKEIFTMPPIEMPVVSVPNISVLHVATKQWEIAIECYGPHLLSNPKITGRLHMAIGACYFNIQNYGEAAWHFIKASESNFEEIDNSYGRKLAFICAGITFIFLCKFTEAETYFFQCLSLPVSPKDNGRICNELWIVSLFPIFQVMCKIAIGDYELAANFLESLQSHSLKCLQAFCYMKSNRLSMAKELLMTLEPTLFVLRSLAVCQTSVIETQMYYNTAMSQSAPCGSLAIECATFALEMHQLDSKVMEYIKASLQTPSSSEYLQFLCFVLEELDQVKKSTNFCKTEKKDGECRHCLVFPSESFQKALGTIKKSRFLFLQALVMCRRNHSHGVDRIRDQLWFLVVSYPENVQLQALSCELWPNLKQKSFGMWEKRVMNHLVLG